MMVVKKNPPAPHDDEDEDEDEDDGFVLVVPRSKGKRKGRRGVARTPTTQAPLPLSTAPRGADELVTDDLPFARDSDACGKGIEEAASRLKATVDRELREFKTSGYWEKTLRTSSVLSEDGYRGAQGQLPRISRSTSYGIGSFSSSRPARLQLVMWLALTQQLQHMQQQQQQQQQDLCAATEDESDEDKGSVVVNAEADQSFPADTMQLASFDPCYTREEVAVLKMYGVDVCAENTQGKDQCTTFNGDRQRSVLIFMPHCPRALYENILMANYAALNRILMIGNRLSSYAERDIGGHLRSAYPMLYFLTKDDPLSHHSEQVLACSKTSDSAMFNAFSDTALHIFHSWDTYSATAQQEVRSIIDQDCSLPLRASSYSITPQTAEK